MRSPSSSPSPASRCAARRMAPGCCSTAPTDAPIGTLLRLGLASGARSFAFIAALDPVADPLGPVIRWRATLDPPPAQPPATGGRHHRHAHAARRCRAGGELHRPRPRPRPSPLARQRALRGKPARLAGRRLGRRAAAAGRRRRSNPLRSDASALRRWRRLLRRHHRQSDFFDSDWSPAEQDAGDGIAAIAAMPDLTQLVVPDLYLARRSGPKMRRRRPRPVAAPGRSSPIASRPSRRPSPPQACRARS